MEQSASCLESVGMMKHCKITFFMNAYNAENYVEQTIKSILNQTERNIQVVIRNNGSTDHTGEICQKWAKKDKRIIYLANRQNHITDDGIIFPDREWWPHFNSKYVSMVDSDDLLDKNFARIMYQAAEQIQAEMVVCGTTMFEDETGKILNRRLPPNIRTKNIKSIENTFPELYGSLRPFWGKIFRTDFFDKYYIDAWEIEEGINGLDTYAVLGYLLRCQKFVSLNQSLHFYRIRKQSAFFASKIEEKRIKEGAVLYERGLECLSTLGIDNAVNRQFLYSVYWGHMWDLLNLLERSIEMTVNEKITFLEDILQQPLMGILLQNDQNQQMIYERFAQTMEQLKQRGSTLDTKRDSYLYRLFDVQKRLDDSQDILAYAVLLASIMDARNPYHFGKYLLRQPFACVLSPGEQYFNHLPQEQQEVLLRDCKKLRGILCGREDQAKAEQLKKQLLTQLDAKDDTQALETLNILSKIEPLGKETWYFLIYLAFRLYQDDLALQYAGIARSLWGDDEDVVDIINQVEAALIKNRA